jgi:xylulokinase
VGDAHLYLGTSAWIARATREPSPVPRAGIAAIPSGAPSGCLAVGETEAAGASRAWAARTLGIVDESELDALASSSPAGARGLIFMPWLFGERAPIPDAMLRGGFANLSLEHERADVARAVLEGVAMNLRGVLDALDPRGVSELRVGGGGAQSDLWLRIVADVTGRRLLRVARPRFAGARGAALVAAVATRAVRAVEELASLVEIDREFAPDDAHAAIYDAGVDALRTMQRPLAHAGALLRGRV